MRGIVAGLTGLAFFIVATGQDVLVEGEGSEVMRVKNHASFGVAIQAIAPNPAYYGIGVYAEGGRYGVEGKSNGQTGVYGHAYSVEGSTYPIGIRGAAYQGTQPIGVSGSANNDGEAIGVKGVAQGLYYKFGILGEATPSYASFAGYFNGDGLVTGYFYSGSDAKLKRNVRALENGLSRIMALRPKSFEMESGKFEDIKLPEGERFGLIAQEVEVVFPELVKDAKAPSRLTEEERKQGVRKTLTCPPETGHLLQVDLPVEGVFDGNDQTAQA